MAYFDCIVGGSGKGNTLVVTCADDLAGATITCTNGTKTYTKTCPSTAPYEVTFYGLAAGTYTVSATVSGDTYTTTVVVADYEAELGGFNWKAWVDLSENYTSSGFTDLDDLLSDETAVRELMTIHACVDYLAEIAAESADVETIISNDLCAKWINNRDYALDTLYANEIIADYMDTADKYFYGEWCLMPQVPTMTSNTAPYGEASASYAQSGYEAYKAFNNNDTDYWNTYGAKPDESINQHIRYRFTNPTCVKSVSIYPRYDGGSRVKNFKVQASNDGSTWTDLYSGQCPNEKIATRFNFDNSEYYLYYQVLVLDSWFGGIAIYTLQFYAYAPKGNVPIMTSNSAPYGEAIASSEGTYYGITYNAFRAFNGDTSGTSRWWHSGNVAGPWKLGYKSTNPICVKRVLIQNPNDSNDTTGYVVNFTLQGSNTGESNDWNDIGEGTCSNPTSQGGINVIDFAANDEYYLYYQIKVTSVTGDNTTNYCRIMTLQFYGRELSVSVPTMTSNTAPYGEASYSGTYSFAQYPPYKVFDKDPSTYGGLGGNQGSYIYDFGKAVNIKKYLMIISFNYQSETFKYKAQASNDGVTWIDDIDALHTVTTSTGTQIVYTHDIVTNGNSYRYFRVYQEYSAHDLGQLATREIQFYGLDYSEKEFETGTTKKWLYDHGVELEEMTPLTSGNSSNVVEKKDNEVYMYKVGTNSAAGIYSPLIDLSDYSLLRAKMGDKSYSSNSGEVSAGMLCISSSTPVDAANMSNVTSYSDYYNSATQGNLPNNLSLDTSSYNEGKYLSFVARSAGNFTKYSTCTELWLE